MLTSSTIELILRLDNINSNLESISKSLFDKTFFDTQIFGTMIGAIAALFIFFLDRLIVFYINRKKANDKVYYLLAENGHLLAPKYIYADARQRQYGGTITDSEGIKTVVPEKPLGEKMLIQLRRHNKYWLYRNFWLRQLFKQYAALLKHFNTNPDSHTVEFKKNMEKAKLIHEKIMKFVYKKTGEDQWSLR